jgi:hypothetical protein
MHHVYQLIGHSVPDMTKCHIAYLASAAALIGTGLGATPATAAPRTFLVHPGESIQQAVNAARSGDTVLVTPGTYHESVTVSTSRLTLRGMGPSTVIEPAAKASNSCAKGGNGICVTGTANRAVAGVTVSHLTVTGFAKTGVLGRATDGLTVRKVYAVGNGVWGIAQEQSVRGVFRSNYARNNGDAGLFLANTISKEQGATDTRGTVVQQNRMEGNRIGLTVRRLRNLSVTGNYVTGNCAGVFVVGDENLPRTGALTVADNVVATNNKSCPKTPRLPALQGSGIVLTGVENTKVNRNLVTGNSGRSPLSGGIVLFKSFVGVTSERNRISENTLKGNAPADLVNQETSKANNTFQGNSCAASKPSGLC